MSSNNALPVSAIASIAEQASDGILITTLGLDDPGPQIVYANPATTKITGYTSAEVIGKTPRLFQGPETDRAELDRLRQQLSEGKNFTGELINYRKDGAKFVVELRIKLLRDRDGTPMHWIAFQRDVTEKRRAEEMATRFGRILEKSLNEIYLFDAETLRFIQVNRGARENLGYSIEELRCLTPLDVKPEFTTASFANLIMPLRNGEKDKIKFVTVHRRKNGTTYPVEVHLQLSILKTSQVFVANILDITELKQTEQALQQEKERAQVTLHSIGDAVITTDADGRIEYLNPVAEELTGWLSDEARSRSLETVFHILDEQGCECAADQKAICLQEGCVIGSPHHSILVSRNGQKYSIQNTLAPIRSREGDVLGTVLVFKDVSEVQRMVQKIAHQAAHDALTGLVNRRAFEERLQRVLETAKAENNEHALCFLDLDRFKIINDSCGHAAGDKLLCQIGGLLQAKIRTRDTLARLGGDEFGVLMEHCHLRQAKRVAEALRKAVEEFRFLWEGRHFTVGVSIGLVAITETSESVATVLREADSACYTAKEKGRNRIHVSCEDDVKGGTP